jgi:hypothetical protein
MRADNRPQGKTNQPVHRRVPVVSPDGRVFGSLSEAAFAFGMRPSTLHPMVHLGLKGWRLATPADLAALSE